MSLGGPGRRAAGGARARLLAALLSLPVLLPPTVSAQPQASERALLAAERRRIEADFAAEEKACATRFAVHGCIEGVRERRRAALAPLRERELALDDAERRARAAERQRAAQARQQAAEARPPAASAAEPAAGPKPRAPARAPSPQAGASAPGDLEAREAREREAAARAAAAQARGERARATQERIERREAERARSGKAVRPLPSPASAASG